MPLACAARETLEVLDLGLVEYRTAWRYQRRLACRRGRGLREDALILLEHPPVYTRGTSAREAALPALPHPVHDAERGGDVTYHGPG
ncbi:MAG TPA: lipoate-protein ligase B, partial [Elusimicrobiota bacterium]|nr:lipoate-protein ligase B [Elusimicrobiota bacterium]